jgi:hypothetical protein
MDALRDMVVVAVVLAAAPVWAADPFAGLPDPTRAYADESPAATGPVLQSTFVSATDRRALVGGRMVRVGDRVGSAEVVAIHAHEVVLKEGARETRLRLIPKLAKDPTLAPAAARGTK